jgi:aminopeptidase N
LKAPYTDAELQHLMVHDTDGFNQWDAGNQFLKNKMLECISAYKEGTPVTVSDKVVTVLKGILEKPDMDLQLKSLALTIPGYSELSLAQDVIDPHAIKAVRKAFLTKIGTDLQSEFLTLYQEHYKPEKEYTLDDAGRREIQNISLSYLSHSGSEAAPALAVAQYESANNITDRGAAFSLVMNMDSGVVDKHAVTKSFYDRNKDNALVMNKWVASQVGGSVSNALEVAQNLENHDLLKSKNPNMLRSLYRGFTGNTGAFHATDGSGYKLLSDAVMEIDKTNTQLAAGMVSVFERFRKYTPDLQGKMETELRRIASSETVSDGLGEKLSAFLGKDTYSQLRSDAGSKVELHIT